LHFGFLLKDLAYYIQGKNNDLAAVASQFAGYYRTWAWTKKGREEFPDNLFSSDTSEDSYLKHQVCKLFQDLVKNQDVFDSLPPNYSEELEDLKAICPQAIITTNYDTFLEDKVFINLPKYGNTSAASIAIALDEAVRAGKLQKGDNLAVAGFGAGLTWASLVMKWC